MCLLCNKTEFAVFNIKNITERYLISVEEIVKARQLLKEQERCAQETLNLCKSLLENIDNASLAKSQNIPMDQFFGTPKCHVKNSQKKSPESSLRSKYLSKSSTSTKVFLSCVRTMRKLKYLSPKLKSKVRES